MILNAGEKLMMVAALTWAAAEHDREARKLSGQGLAIEAANKASAGIEFVRLASMLKRGDVATLSETERQAVLAGIRWAAMTHEKISAEFFKELKHTNATAAAAASRECSRIADMLERAN